MAVATDPTVHAAIQQLHATYADVVTRRAWAELDPLFLPDSPITVDPVSRSPVQLDGAAGLAAFVANALERFTFFELVPLNHVVTEMSAGAARGRLWMVELRQERETESWSEAYGRYDDEYALVDGRWRYRRRSYR